MITHYITIDPLLLLFQSPLSSPYPYPGPYDGLPYVPAPFDEWSNTNRVSIYFFCNVWRSYLYWLWRSSLEMCEKWEWKERPCFTGHNFRVVPTLFLVRTVLSDLPLWMRYGTKLLTVWRWKVGGDFRSWTWNWGFTFYFARKVVFQDGISTHNHIDSSIVLLEIKYLFYLGHAHGILQTHSSLTSASLPTCTRSRASINMMFVFL